MTYTTMDKSCKFLKRCNIPQVFKMTHKHEATGLGIKSTNPKHWLPNPAKSVIMPASRYSAFMQDSTPASLALSNGPTTVPQPSVSAWAAAGFSVVSKP